MLISRNDECQAQCHHGGRREGAQLKAQGRGHQFFDWRAGIPAGSHVYDAAAAALRPIQYGSNRGPDALLTRSSNICARSSDRYERRNCDRHGAKHVLQSLKPCSMKATDPFQPYWTATSYAQIVGARVDLIAASAEQNYKITRSSSTKRWRTSRKRSCSTIQRIQLVWSTTKVKSPAG